MGIRVVDVRSEASAVAAADLRFRLTGLPGVAVVCALAAAPRAPAALTFARAARRSEAVLVPCLLSLRGTQRLADAATAALQA